MKIKLPDNNHAEVRIAHSDDGLLTVVSPTYDHDACEDSLSYVIGNLLIRKLIDATKTTILVTYTPHNSIIENVYEVKINGDIPVKTVDNGLFPFAILTLNKSLDNSLIIPGIKNTLSWSRLKGTTVKFEMNGQLEPVTGKLIDVTEDGYYIEGYDIPMKGRVVEALAQ